MENDDLRDLYAGLAMMGLLANGSITFRSPEDLAYAAFSRADAMMKFRTPDEGIASIKKPRKKKENGNEME